MAKRYPGRTSFTQWRRTPYRKKHRLVGIVINNYLRHWRDCEDARCRRARSCQDHECNWQRLETLATFDERMRVREQTGRWKRLLSIGSSKGSEGSKQYCAGDETVGRLLKAVAHRGAAAEDRRLAASSPGSPGLQKSPPQPPIAAEAGHGTFIAFGSYGINY